MHTPNIKLFDDLVEISKSDIKFIDHIRPFFQEKYQIDIHDLLFKDLLNTDTNIYSKNPIANDTPSPDYRPLSPSTIADDDMPISDDEWHFSSPSQDSPVDSSIRDVEYQGTHYINDRLFYNRYDFCKWNLNCQSYNFLCGNSYINEFGNVKKCVYHCHFYFDLPQHFLVDVNLFCLLYSNNHYAAHVIYAE